jgi:hypothetical protein
MDVFSRSESFLPEFQFNSGVELMEAGVEMALERLWLRQIDGMGLVRILL